MFLNRSWDRSPLMFWMWVRSKHQLFSHFLWTAFNDDGLPANCISCMCTYICICMCICKHCMHTRTCAHMCTYVCICRYMNINMRMNDNTVYTYINIHQHIYVETPMSIPLRMRPISAAITKIKQIETYWFRKKHVLLSMRPLPVQILGLLSK